LTATAQPGQRGAPAGAPSDRESWSEEVDRLDLAVYLAIAETPTPRLDRVFRQLSRAADRSKLWIATATVLATVGGARGRRAALNGLASIAVTSAASTCCSSRSPAGAGRTAPPTASRSPAG
jgi:hypothetical protein